MSELSAKLKDLRKNQTRVRYFKHYYEQDNFIIEGLSTVLVQIVITNRTEAVSLMLALQQYIFDGIDFDE